MALGAAVPLAAAPFLEARMGFDFAGGVYGKPLLEAAAFGVLTTLVFSLWPLARAQQIAPLDESLIDLLPTCGIFLTNAHRSP